MHSNDTPRDTGLAQWFGDPIVEPGARVITRLAAQKKDPTRVSVYIDGAFAFGLPQHVVAKHLLRKGLHVDDELQAILLREDQLTRAKIRALEYLSYCPRTEHEVAKKLKEKAFDETIIAEVIERFKELGYLNDSQYAKLYAYSRLRSKGRGPRRIKQELKKRGVQADDIDAAITQLRDTEDIVQEMRPRAEKRWNKLAKERNRFKRRQKFTQYLLRQGFDYQTAHQLYTELQQAEDERKEEQTEEWPPMDPMWLEQAHHEEEDEEEEMDPLAEHRPIAEKRWARLSSETSPQRKRQKLADFLRRRGINFDVIKPLTEELEAQDREQAAIEAAAREDEDEYEEEEEEVDPLEAIRPLAEKRWRRLLKGESNRRKRRQKLTDYLRRQGFRFEQISPIFDELEDA